jgi:hypothetical protein
MKAIRTKYSGPTDTRGSRIIASDEDGNRVTVHYDSAKNSADNHAIAAVRLAEKMGWTGHLIAGSLGKGYVFVWSNSERIPVVSVIERKK